MRLPSGEMRIPSEDSQVPSGDMQVPQRDMQVSARGCKYPVGTSKYLEGDAITQRVTASTQSKSEVIWTTPGPEVKFGGVGVGYLVHGKWQSDWR